MFSLILPLIMSGIARHLKYASGPLPEGREYGRVFGAPPLRGITSLRHMAG
jgi:hypothetical protein